MIVESGRSARALTSITAVGALLLAHTSSAQTYVSYAHCKQDEDSVRVAWTETSKRWQKCFVEFHSTRAHGRHPGCRSLEHEKDALERRFRAIQNICHDIRRQEYDRQRAAREEQERLNQQRQVEARNRQKLPDNYFLRQQELMRQQAAGAARARQEQERREQARQDAASRAEMLSSAQRMLQSALGKPARHAQGNEQYDRVHDKADKLRQRLDRSDDVAGRYRDAASEEVRYRNQETLQRSNEFSQQFAEFGRNDIANAQRSAPSSSLAALSNSPNPWAAARNAGSSQTSSGSSQNAPNPWGSASEAQLALTAPTQNPWVRVEPAESSSISSSNSSATPGRQQTRTRDAAILADDAYYAHRNGHQIPRGWTMLDKRPGDDGFFAAAYKNNTTGEIVVSFRGTDDMQDPRAYPGLATGRTDGTRWGSQVEQARAYTHYIQTQHPDATISFTGHSLGGALAQVEGARTGWQADSFNAPGVRSTIGNLYPDRVSYSENIRNHRRETDEVSRVGSHFGSVITYPGIDTTVSRDPRHFIGDSAAAAWDQHRMNLFRSDIEGGYWDAAQRIRNPWSTDNPTSR